MGYIGDAGFKVWGLEFPEIGGSLFNRSRYKAHDNILGSILGPPIHGNSRGNPEHKALKP